MPPRLALVLIACAFATLLLGALLKVLLPALWQGLTDLFGGGREEFPPDWHGQAPPACRACGYDLRSSPEFCPECGARVDPLDGIIVRYLMSVGHSPPPGCDGDGGFKVVRPPRGEVRLR